MEAVLHHQPTRFLRADHQSVLDKLDSLEYIIGILDQVDQAVSSLTELGDFFRAGMWTHVWKEEDALFPALRQCLTKEADPTGQMLRQHQGLRSASERFQRDVDGYLKDPGDKGAAALVRESGPRFAGLVRDHFQDEDGALYAVAEESLTTAQEQQIWDLFNTIDADLAWCFEQLEDFTP